MENPSRPEASKQSYSAALQSPTKSSATKHPDVEQSPTKAGATIATKPPTTNTNTNPSNPDVFELQPTLSPKPAARTQRKKKQSKVSYSAIAGNSPTTTANVPSTLRQRVAFKRNTMGGIISSPSKAPSDGHEEDNQQDHECPAESTTTSPLPENIPAFERGTQTSELANHTLEAGSTDWKAKHADACFEQKAVPEREESPAPMKNGLLEALDNHLKKKEAAKKDPLIPKPRFGGLREAVQAAARDSAAKYGSGRSPAKEARHQVADVPANDTAKDVPALKPTAATATPKKGWVSKPAIPFDPHYVGKRSWLVNSDELPRHLRGRTKHSPSPEIPTERCNEGGSVPDTDRPKTASATKKASMGKTKASQTETHESPFHWTLHGLENRLRNSGYDGDLADYFGETSKRAQQTTTAAGDDLFGPEAWAVVDEEAERVRWDNIQANMRSSGFDKSPFVPQTFEDYLQHKRIMAINRQMSALRKIREEAEEGDGGAKPKSQSQPQSQKPTPSPMLAVAAQLSQQLVEAPGRDGLTTVLGRPSVWTQRCLEQAEVGWPTPAEYEAAGAIGTLPLPTVGNPGDKKKDIADFALTPAFDMLSHEEARKVCGLDPVEKLEQQQEQREETEEKPTELSLDEINPITASFIRSIRPGNGD